ncbi:protein mono-ADP-ribosyltransferase TIPARP-like [Scomber scombrus]|uniref:protein mono-ADP-ribosyltransferase TIPARP-like n=1 Tax=Scomber scombrus TaxID=13677 RepID=UPI002DDB8530|nr:protein mono-ADP-ribosyltransferase TIPARP-like [Scomber scombrus]
MSTTQILRKKPKLSADVSALEQQSKSSKVTLQSPSLLILEIPPDTNTSLPVWEAMMSQQVASTWTVNPYSIGLHLTPATPKQKNTTAPRKSERVSNMAKTSKTPSMFVHPYSTMVIQPIAQQHGASQKTPSVLLTFPQNQSQVLPSPSSESQNVAPNPAMSFIASLPLLITQPPPAPKPMIQILPKATNAKPQAPAGPQSIPSLFHTKSSSDINICDRFLLSVCQAGKNCDMHHTPYPFHWQLWCIVSHQWINISLCSQVLLERIYCNVKHEGVKINDGKDHYTLGFESMEVNGTYKYESARRLSNSDSLIINPYFPTKWRIYWWDSGWEEYDQDTSDLLREKMSEKESECFFHIGRQEYKVDFAMMTQTNVTTGYQRAIRCRPIYRSTDSMQPYLKTGIETDPIQPATDPPGHNFSVDPLKEFSSWYPPVWGLASERDYSLVHVPAGTRAYRCVQNLFYESLHATSVDIISIQQVQNILHWDKYQRHKAYMQKQPSKSKEPLERHLFHGTTKEASEAICHNNFDPRVAGVNGTSYGNGSYFATTADVSNYYSTLRDDVRHMFLAKVLVGQVCVGRTDYRRPPPIKSKMSQYRLYDSCVDVMNKPTMFVVFDSCQCYPYYLIKYKDLPAEIDI